MKIKHGRINKKIKDIKRVHCRRESSLDSDLTPVLTYKNPKSIFSKRSSF